MVRTSVQNSIGNPSTRTISALKEKREVYSKNAGELPAAAKRLPIRFPTNGANSSRPPRRSGSRASSAHCPSGPSRRIRTSERHTKSPNPQRPLPFTPSTFSAKPTFANPKPKSTNSTTPSPRSRATLRPSEKSSKQPRKASRKRCAGRRIRLQHSKKCRPSTERRLKAPPKPLPRAADKCGPPANQVLTTVRSTRRSQEMPKLALVFSRTAPAAPGAHSSPS